MIRFTTPREAKNPTLVITGYAAEAALLATIPNPEVSRDVAARLRRDGWLVEDFHPTSERLGWFACLWRPDHTGEFAGERGFIAEHGSWQVSEFLAPSA